MVAAVVFGTKHGRVAAGCNRRRKIDNAIEGPAVPDPVVDRLTLGFAGLRPVEKSLERCERPAKGLYSPGMGLSNDLLIPDDDFGGGEVRPRQEAFRKEYVRRGGMAYIVETRENNQVRDTRL